MNFIIQLNNTIQLSDGRNLGFAVYGNPDGYPVLFFHGIPGSRLQRNPDPGVLSELDICIYALDRPGIGLSSGQSTRSLLSWTDDVLEFCTQMNFSRFAVAGVSGGGPYALACAWQFPEKISHLSVISGIGPIAEPAVFMQLKTGSQRLFRLAKKKPEILKIILSIAYKLFRKRIWDAFLWLTGELPACDINLLTRSEIQEMLCEDVQQAFSLGSQGILQEIQVLMQPWNFNLHEIQIPVHFWHGIDDTIVPFSIAKLLSERIPTVKTHFIPAGGHFIALELTYAIFSSIAHEQMAM